jgi:hypothetical protein
MIELAIRRWCRRGFKWMVGERLDVGHLRGGFKHGSPTLLCTRFFGIIGFRMFLESHLLHVPAVALDHNFDAFRRE